MTVLNVPVVLVTVAQCSVVRKPRHSSFISGFLQWLGKNMNCRSEKDHACEYAVTCNEIWDVRIMLLNQTRCTIDLLST